MKAAILLTAGVSASALVASAPAMAQSVPEPAGQPPAGEIETGAGADQGEAGQAQSTTARSADASTNEQGDIIITAQRRSEALQQVPIAVSAFTGEALERQQIDNASDLQLSLPNVTFTKTNFTSSSFTIRGIGDLCVGFSCDTATAIHVNDMPLVSTRLFETEYFDLDRVEVLRGPQGTLFGRNATSGVVNFITARPRLDNFAASASAEYGSYQSVKLNGMVNIPIADAAAFRLAGYYLKRDGFTKNIADDSRIDGRELFALRGSIRLRPASGTTVDVVGYHFSEDDDRSRIQKQLCHNDPTGILGCLPDKLAFETVNGNSTLAATLSSQQFLNIASGGNPLFGTIGLTNVYGPDQFFGGVENPNDLRTVNIDFKPQYKATETHLMARVEQDLGSGLSATVTGGYARNTVDSRTDYSLVAGNSLAGNTGLLTLAALAAQPGALFGGTNPFTPVAGALIPNGPTGAVCTSETNLYYTGVFGGFVNRCTAAGTEYDRSRSTSVQWSLEGQVSSDFEGPLNFLAGAIYLDNKFEKSDYFVASFGLDYASGVLGALQTLGQRQAGNFFFPSSFLAPPFFNSEVENFRLKSYGIFGEAYYDITDQLKFTAGLRFSHDKKRQVARAPLLSWLTPFPLTNANDSPFLGEYDADESVAGNQTYAVGKVSFGRLTGRAVLDYQITPNNLVYASYSRGYKSGGINPPIDPTFDINPQFDPETINAFEIGSKNTFAGGAVRLNLSGFLYDYKGLQLSRIVGRTSVNDNTDARIWGVEAEALFRPTRDLQLNLSASYLKSKIKGLSLVDPRDPSGGRSDVVIIKDLQTAANCVVVPGAGGAAAANLYVGAVNSALGLAPPTPVPATNTTGAYSLCEILAQTAANPDPVLRGLFGVPTGPLPFTVTTGIEQDLTGNELPQSPNFKFSAGAQYTIRLGGGMTLVPRADFAWTGKYYARSFNRPIDRVDGYEVVNAQIQLNGADERWFARAFVTNLTKNDAITGQYVGDQSSGLYTNVFTLEPRVFGVGAGVKF
ncbi:TonB-dependent receptor [Sphingomonas arenae]|uniref:TonB-dependent receptor n=1 Tax=Sphingomonas arenae TaxID=2812555 RepID=UPI0019679E1B|nr:TonB-dependent receptor [Sphingomonas arenae]